MKKLLCILLYSLSCTAMQTPLRFLEFNIVDIAPPNDSGSIGIVIDGGVGPYTYKIGAITLLDRNVKTVLVGGLAAGQYEIIVIDSAENTIAASLELVDLEEKSIHVIRIVVGNVTGVNNGSLFIDAASASAFDPDYSIDGGEEFQELGTFKNLPPATYHIVVSTRQPPDAPRWTGRVPLIQVSTAPVISVQTTPADSISGKGGLITIEATGGVPPYQFSIDGGKTFSTGSRFTNVPAGIYQIKIVDSNQVCVTTQATVGQERVMSDNTITDFITEKYCDGESSF